MSVAASPTRVRPAFEPGRRVVSEAFSPCAASPKFGISLSFSFVAVPKFKFKFKFKSPTRTRLKGPWSKKHVEHVSTGIVGKRGTLGLTSMNI